MLTTKALGIGSTGIHAPSLKTWSAVIFGSWKRMVRMFGSLCLDAPNVKLGSGQGG